MNHDQNPYAPPAAGAHAPERPTVELPAERFEDVPFASPKWHAIVSAAFYSLALFALLVHVATIFLSMGLLLKIMDGYEATQVEWDADNLRMSRTYLAAISFRT